jgi:RimJ/RimL family protein N-acetyltransferase
MRAESSPEPPPQRLSVDDLPADAEDRGDLPGAANYGDVEGSGAPHRAAIAQVCGSREPSIMLNLMRRARVGLRPLRPADYDTLYEAVTLTEGGLFEQFQGQTPSPENFVRALWSGVLVQFVPEQRSKPIGLLVAHGAQLNDGICTVTHVTDEKFSDKAHGDALSQFIEYLFANWELRKLYMEISERRRSSFLVRGGQAFSEEGCLRDHEFHQGRYWSRYIYALGRDDPRKLN